MNLTVEQYKQMRLFEGLTDRDILESCGYSRNYKGAIQKWKKENGIKQHGRSKIQLLDHVEVKEYLKNHTIEETALYFGVNIGNFRKWLKDDVACEL